ncbi:MAG: hypothetical protein JJ992_17910 [Planctomycetes bacterium]|nr:hypothetical protein [Planctomycetota bacterium]
MNDDECANVCRPKATTFALINQFATVCLGRVIQAEHAGDCFAVKTTGNAKIDPPRLGGVKEGKVSI